MIMEYISAEILEAAGGERLGIKKLITVQSLRKGI
jgi:hypothetical protein